MPDVTSQRAPDAHGAPHGPGAPQARPPVDPYRQPDAPAYRQPTFGAAATAVQGPHRDEVSEREKARNRAGDKAVQLSIVLGILAMWSPIFGPFAIWQGNKAEALGRYGGVGRVLGWIGTIVGLIVFMFYVWLLYQFRDVYVEIFRQLASLR